MKLVEQLSIDKIRLAEGKILPSDISSFYERFNLCRFNSEASLRALGRLLLPFAKATEYDDTFDGVLIRYGISTSNMINDISRTGIFEHSARWAQSGFPTISLSAKQASALALSEIHKDQVSRIEAPWKAFCIRIPTGALESVRRICVHIRKQEFTDVFVNSGPWTVRIDYWDGKEDVCLWDINRSVKHLSGIVDEGLCGGGDNERGIELDSLLEPKDRRVIRLCSRLVAATILAMNSCKVTHRRRGEHKKPMGISVGYSEYEIGLPVNIDCREYVRDYLSSDVDRFRRVRWLTRGHFRNQACGPGRSLHKEIWIEPHWKGRQTAPILVREHVLGGV